MIDRNPEDLLQDMVNSSEDAIRFIADMDFATFLLDKRTNYAVVYAVEAIGEASKHIPQSLKAQYSNIPWRSIAETRDQLIDEYFGVDLQVLWDTVQNDIPPLKTAIAQVLADLSPES